ncbi:MAG: hypothetical protein U0929_19620 [Planctomycetaceae bacterium]
MTGGMVPSSSSNANSSGNAGTTGTNEPAPKREPNTPAPPATNPDAKNPPATTNRPASRPGVRESSPLAPGPRLIDDEGIPPFHLARLSLDGEVSNDRAIITAQIDVDVNSDGEDEGLTRYHDVPLRLTQAHILSKEYVGPGQEGPVVDRPVEDGIVWRFTGYGTHQLKLKMWVPIRQSPAGRQLVLSLPTMPPGFDAQVNLAIPGSPIVIRSNGDLSVLSNTHAENLNRVSADVRGPRLDMTWSEPPEVQNSFLESRTSVTLRRDGDRVIATAEQVLFPENVGVKEAEIKLPDGFELDELSGSLVKGHEAIPGRNGWRKISFRESSGERIDLNWVLSAPFPVEGGKLSIDGWVVSDARSQAGRIRLQDFPGYQMVPRLSQFVRRATPNSPQTLESFEFTKQPFQISWDVQRVASKFSARPHHLLFIGTSQMVLESRFRIQTDTGSIEQIDLGWNTGKDEGWRLDPASVSGDVVIPPLGDQLNQTGRLLVGWTTPKSGLIDLNLRFFRPMPSGVQSASVSLPRIRGARSLSADLLVAAEDQYEVTLTGAKGAALQTSVSDPARLEGVAPALVSQIQRAVTLDPDQDQIELSWNARARVVEADAEVELRRATDGRVHVQQTVRFQSRFGRLSSVRFQLPKSLLALIPAGAASSAIGVTIDGQSMKPQIHDSAIETSLSEPRLGEILVTLEYSLPVSTSTPNSTVVPVLMSLDTKYSSIRVRIPEGETLRVPPTAEGWQPVPTSPDATVWVTSSANQVPVILDADQTTSPRFSVDRAFYRTRFDSAGRVEGVCELHWNWSGDVRGLPITLPPESEYLGAMYNGKSLDDTQVFIDPRNPSQIQFRLPASQDGSRLAVAYRSTKPASFSNRDLRTVPLPVLPKDVSVVRSTWELELPSGRHLFMSPAALTSENQWQRRGVLWSRTPTANYVADRNAATTETRQLLSLLQTSLPDASQVYAFSSIGPIESPRFQSMSRSLVVLVGAGMTLALGFLFWNLPIVRNIQAMLLLAFGVSILSLWFLEPIQLLLQSAVLGAVLALLATLIDVKSRRPVLRTYPSTVLPMPTSLPGTHTAGQPGAAPSSPNSPPAEPAAGRGSSVSRQRSHPMTPTAIYQPGHSEVGSPP